MMQGIATAFRVGIRAIMFAPDQHQLLDFGEGRKLERFGPFVLDRPAVGTEGVARALSAGEWRAASARFEREAADRGRWIARTELPARWNIVHGRLAFELRPTPFGHLGLFPEQAVNWDWLAEQLHTASDGLRVLNLFAYTGGSTLAAAAAGAQLTHVDAAANVVAWARKNAALSSLEEAPIRWIAEDAQRFAQRELKRGRAYDAVILDPPSFGRGPGGQTWKLAEHLGELLETLATLTADRRRLVLMTCHTSGLGIPAVKQIMRDALGTVAAETLTVEPLTLEAATGARLSCGLAARWVATQTPSSPGRGPG
jgi:23S rRNA (cytosine1962-C5)-methyltransferase